MLLEAVAAAFLFFLLHPFLPWIRRRLRLLSFLKSFPGPLALPLVGNGLQMSDPLKLTEFLVDEANRQRSRGHKYMLIWLGPRPVVIPLDGEALKPILDSTEEIDKGTDYDIIIPWLGYGLLISTGQRWRAKRRMLTPTFHFAMLDGYVETMDKHAKILCDILDYNLGVEVDLMQFVKRCALDIICETAMGKDLGCQHNPAHPYIAHVQEMGTLARDHSTKPWTRFPPVWNLFNKGRYDRVVDSLTGFTKEVIAERMEARANGEETGEGKRKAFLDQLLDMAGENNLTAEEVREEVDTFMFEGHDTSATGVAWSLWCLATHPEVQQKAFEEVHSVFGDSERSCSVEDLKRPPYLDRVIKESMRVFPPVPVVGRKMKGDLDVGRGLVVPSACDVLIMPIVIHHNDKVYPSHWSFDPDNFLPDRLSSRHAYDFVPFSAGPRNCIGQRFAVYEEKLLVSSILRRLSLHSPYSMADNISCPQTILAPSLGCPVTLKRRL